LAQTPDPVEAIRRTILEQSTNDDNIAEELALRARECLLRERIGTLRSPWDLSRALLLREWNTASHNDRLRTQDLKLREEVGKRFLDELHRALHDDRTTPAIRLAFTNLLEELGPRLRVLAATNGTTRLSVACAAELIRLLEDRDPDVRIAACRALGRVQGKPGDSADALGDVVRRGRSIPDKLAALDGLTHLLHAEDGLAGETESQALRERLAEAARLVLTAVTPGVLDAHPVVRHRSLEVLCDTVQAVSQAVDDANPSCWRQVIHSLSRLGEPLAHALVDPQFEVRQVGRKAVYEVSFLGRRWSQLQSDVAKSADGVRQAAWTAEASSDRKQLADAMLPTVAVLSRQLADPQPGNRLSAVESLELLGEVAIPAAEALSRTLADPDRFVRWAAVRTLGKLPALPVSPFAERISPLLLDPDSGVRCAAAAALERFETRAHASVPTLLRALTEGSDPEAQVALLHALALIGGAKDVNAVGTVCTLLRSPNARVRRAALETLGQFGPTAAVALPNLRRALGDPDEAVRDAARSALSAVSPGAGDR
jgi:HEAT repeat protein